MNDIYQSYATTTTTTAYPYNYGDWNTAVGTISSNGFTWTYSDSETVEDTVKRILKEMHEKENEKMTTNFYFGSYNTNDIRLSMYGMAIKNKNGKWVSYDIKTGTLIDVEIFNIEIDAKKVFYKLPKAIDEVKAGDIVLHNDKPVFVEVVRPDGKFEVIDPYEGTAIIILPLKSPFGFNYVSVIVALTDFLPKANEKSPFGNLLPLLLAGSDNNGLMIAMLMQDKDIDPMMLAMMCGKGDMSGLALMMMMDKFKSKKVFYGPGSSRHAMYGPGIEDMDE